VGGFFYIMGNLCTCEQSKPAPVLPMVMICIIFTSCQLEKWKAISCL